MGFFDKLKGKKRASIGMMLITPHKGLLWDYRAGNHPDN